MANVAALKKKAAEYEQRKQLDKAVAAYREVLDVFDAGGEENVDVGLYNRVGDLLVRQGSTSEAVTLYERAVDLYAEGGFFNNAIALCNKILRTSPGRASVYYKLGKISAAKGFKGDAKQNFLEYADRMQKSGQMEEAFRALKEFADLCPDQDDIRLMLAEQLTKADRKSEALDQLQQLYARYDGEGRSSEAAATLERMRAIDPTAEVKSVSAGSKAKADDLVFLDLDAPPEPRRTRRTRAVAMPESPPVGAQAGMVPTSEPPALPAVDAEKLVGLELTAFGNADVIEPVPLPPSAFDEIDLSSIREAQSSPHRMSTRDLALGGDLPLIELGTPAGASVTVANDLPLIELTPAAGTIAVMDELRLVDLGTPARGTPMQVQPLDFEPTAFDVGAGALDVEPIVADASLPEAEHGAARSAFPLFGAEGSDRSTGAGLDAEVGDTISEVQEEVAAQEEARASARAEEKAEEQAEHVEELVASAPESATDFGEVANEHVDAPPPPVRRTSSMLANSAGVLRVRIEDEPANWAVRRQYAEALLDDGSREEGLKELEAALVGFEKDGDLDAARSLADEIIRLNPSSVRHHQKRVEYAFRANDRPRLAEAYLALADALFRDGQGDRAKVVYQRVLDIVPDELRAKTALEAYGAEAPSAPAAPATLTETASHKSKRYTGPVEPGMSKADPAAGATKPSGDDEFVSLGDWLRDQEEPKSTRMVVDEEQPSGDEAADFADMLKKFKAGVAQNVEEEDHESHYDLGVAFKEMGLVDEAISEFQKALRGAANRVRTYEALGQCFLEKKQFAVAVTILQRALNEPGVGDERLIGVLYLLGYISEALGKPADAKGFYERVFSVDIQFRDVGDRLNAVDKALT